MIDSVTASWSAHAKNGHSDKPGEFSRPSSWGLELPADEPVIAPWDDMLTPTQNQKVVSFIRNST
jgi:hypothetical protein